MQYTNNLNLPQSLCNAVQRDIYVPGTSDAGVTELCKPMQQAVLERQHYDEIVVDVSDQIFALMGKAIHHVLEVSDTELTEKRLYKQFPNGLTLGGQFDRFVLKDGTLQDYKVASVWSYIFESYDEWIDQLNAYALLLRQNGYEVNRIEVVMIFRDWSATMAERSDTYPPHQVMVKEFEFRNQLDTYELMQKRIEQFVKCLDNQDSPPDCTAEQMWEQPTKYALMKEGRKSAIKVSEDYGLLELYAITKNLATISEVPNSNETIAMFAKGISIETRPGTRKRCEKYCNAAPWCPQYREYLIQQLGDDFIK